MDGVPQLLLFASGALDWRVLLMFFGVIIVMILLPRIARRNFKLRRRQEKTFHDRAEDTLKVKSEADRVLLDLVEVGQAINSQIDTKMRVLNGLIRDAEKIAERLERAANSIAKIPETSGGATIIIPKLEPVNARSTVIIDHPDNFPPDNPLPDNSSPDNSSPDNSSKNLDLPPTVPAPTACGNSGESGRFAARVKIVALYRTGKEPREIARETRMSLAEVNLAIDYYLQMSRANNQ